MRYSQFFIKTGRHLPADEETPGAKLLVKAGFISKLASGLYNYLPLGLKVLKKIKKVIGQELEKAGVVEILAPIVQPAELWKNSKRYFEIDDELWKIKNNRDEEYVLAMTAEEAFSEIVKNRIQSYKDLPLILNQFQTKIRNELRPRGGLIRAREFLMQDAYSFDADEKGLSKNYHKIFKAYERIFKRLGLDVLSVEADVGAMGGSESAEFMIKNEDGEDKIVMCSKCGYAANIDRAESYLPFEQNRAKKQEKEKVKTTGMTSVEEVAAFLKIQEKDVLKTMIYKTKQSKKLVMVLIRGDLEINEKKLVAALGKEVTAASEKDLEKADLVAGYVSPINLADDEIKVVADTSVKFMSNFVAGANARDYHYKNANLSDFEVDEWSDLVQVKEGDKCKKCGSPLKIERAIELGHLFKLGTKYSEALDVKFTGLDGKEKPVLMGSYGIGLGWPMSVAPFQAYLINISDNEKSKEIIEKVYQDLVDAGIEVLYDDRDISAGVKFGDCDLLGIPLRIVVSQKTLAKNSVEIKMRDSKKTELVETENLRQELEKIINI